MAAKTLTSTLIVRLLDRISGPAQGAARSIRGIGDAANAANRRAGVMAGQAQGAFHGLQTSMNRVQRSAVGASVGVSAPLMMIGRVGAEGAYNYAKVGNAVEAVGLLTEEQRKGIERYSKELNASFPFTNSQILGAAEELLKAGLTYEQTMGSLAGTLQLSQAGDLGTGLATDIATNVMTAMRLPMETAEQAQKSLQRVNDTLAYAASKSNTTVDLMGQTFKYVAPIAAAAGLSIEEIAGASMMLANNGIKGSEAGVAMRSALVRMVRPTKPMMAALERLNLNLGEFVEMGREINATDITKTLQAQGLDVSAFEDQINAALNDEILQQAPARMIEEIASIISEGLGSESAMDRDMIASGITDALLSSAERVDFLGFMRKLREIGATTGDIASIFDVRQGSRLASMLAGDFDRAVEELMAKAPGAAQKMAETRMKGIVGSVARWQAAWENLFISIAESGVMDAAANALDKVAGAVTRLGETNPALLRFGTYALGALAVAGPLAFALSGLGSAVGLIASVGMVPVQMVAGIARWGSTAAKNAVSLQTALAGMSGQNYTGLQKARIALGGIARAVPGVGMLGKIAAGVGTFVGAITAPAWGAIAVGVAAVGAAGYFVWKYWDRLSAIFSGVARAIGDQLAPAFDAAKPYFEWVAPLGDKIASGWNAAKDAVGGFFEWLGSFFSKETLTDEQRAGFEQAGHDAATWIIDGLVSGMGAIASAITFVPRTILNTIIDIGQGTIERAYSDLGMSIGEALAQSVKAKIGELVEWFKGLPGKIIGAIGNIDLSNIISWPSPPSWWTNRPGWLGGSGGLADAAQAAMPTVVAPPVAANDNGLEPALSAAREIAALKRESAGSWFSLSGADKKRLSELEAQLEATTAGMPDAARADIAAYTAALAAGGDQAEAEAARIAAGIEEKLGITVRPLVDTSSISAAQSSVDRLNASLRQAGSVTPNVRTPAVAGARAKGGPVYRGKTYLVGEEGEELFTPDRNGRIIPNGETMDMLRQSGGSSISSGGSASRAVAGSREINIHIHGVSDPEAVAEAVKRKLEAEMRAEMRALHAA